MKLLLCLVSLLVFSSTLVRAQVQLTTAGVFQFSNSYIVSDGTNAILIDTGLNVTHVNMILNLLATQFTGIPVTSIYITHGHPDHYSGVAYLPSSFNSIPVYVANQQVKNELLSNIRNNNFGIAGGLPSNVSSYPYNSRVQVLPDTNLPGLVRNLTVLTTFSPADTHSFGLVYDAVQGVVWSGDLLFRNRHAYFGPTLSVSEVQKWIDQIAVFVTGFPNGLSGLYPGHGPAPYVSVNEALQFQFYLKRFLGLVNACVPPANLPAQMVHLFPRFNDSAIALQFLLLNPAWANYQTVACDTTNSTRAVLCGNLNSKETCSQARPLCFWRRTTTSGRRRSRPRNGTCLPSLRPVRPSQPFGP